MSHAMTNDDIQACLLLASKAVKEAGAIALEYFRGSMAVENKLEGIAYDPVTDADRDMETHIREQLAAHYPGLRVVGEEHGDSGEGENYWIIDPIDGTRAFISGMPTWGTLLGLVVDGQSVCGVMHQPFTGETYSAGPAGAFLEWRGRSTPLRTRSKAALGDAVLYSTHPFMLDLADLAGPYDQLAKRVRLQRWGGDCYSFALLALGTIDLVVDACLMPYDIVPLIPIIEGAGGVVTDLDGQSPLDGGTVVAAANAPLHEQAIAILRGEEPCPATNQWRQQ